MVLRTLTSAGDANKEMLERANFEKRVGQQREQWLNGQVVDLSIRLNQQLLLRGTGRRYKDQVFTGVVIDIDPINNSVKVKYDDGGYKRFTESEIQELRIHATQSGHEIDVLENHQDNQLFTGAGQSGKLRESLSPQRLGRANTK